MHLLHLRFAALLMGRFGEQKKSALSVRSSHLIAKFVQVKSTPQQLSATAPE